ncbi:unnamed protein product [Rhodiola kirilowii]
MNRDVHMDALIDENGADLEEIEDNEFNCCVCLELMYKPVVLACGHICCFWCLLGTMNAIMKSNCPICRHPYNHFPNVCKLLHIAIKTLYPKAYKKREMQIVEEEKKRGYCSPQFPEDFDNRGCSEAVLEGQKDSEASCSGNKIVRECRNQTPKNLSSVDFLCPSCKSLLFRPVVLNCGHVHCERCLPNQPNSILKCQVCESPNPNGLPKVCLVLDNLICDQFRELYGQRRESLLKLSDHGGGGSTSSAIQTSQRTTSTDDCALWWTDRGPKVHIGVGCDYCGMKPILGERYKCLDCTEIIGFDLCETCYARSSILPGRFNQQHRLYHRFEIKQPDIFNYVIIRPQVGESDEDDENSSHDAPDDTVDGLSNASLTDAPPPS